MSFASVSFLLFFLVVLLLLLLVQRVLPFAEIKRRIICQGILLIASYVFYGWWNMRLCLLLMGITWISFFTAVKKDEKHLRQSRISLLIGVGTPLGCVSSDTGSAESDSSGRNFLLYLSGIELYH